MDPKRSVRMEQNRSRATIGVITLAMVSLLAGASVSATLEDYAAPVYAEEDPFEGAVDDVTGEDTWEAKETESKPFGKHIRKAMKSRMDDRMEDRTEHLEKRIQIDSNLIAAFQFCQDNANCTADAESLSEMIGKLSTAVDGMQAKLDGSDSLVDKEDYEDGTQEECEEKGGTWTNDDRKGEYCAFADEYKDWDERKDWDEEERMEFSEEKSIQLRAAHQAISFCISSQDCSADQETLGTVLEHMTSRENHHSECSDDQRCDRDHDRRKGFRGRVGGVFCKMLDRCEDRGQPLPAPPQVEITQEMCESRMGVWTEATDRGEGVFYCDWTDDREDDRGDEEQETSDNQEDCEANGGTWYEDRQYCHTCLLYTSPSPRD